MRPTDALSQDAVHLLPLMRFDRIRRAKGLGAPVGESCSGFTILVEEHTTSQFRISPGGVIEVIPGTGIWKTTTGRLRAGPCRTRATCTWSDPMSRTCTSMRSRREVPSHAHPTGRWPTSSVQVELGTERIEPPSYDASLTEGQHIRNLDFEVVRAPWRLRPFG